MSKAEAAAEITKETVEVIEETLETLERIPKLWLNGTTKKQQIVILSATALAGAAASGAVVLTVVKRRLKTKYEMIAEAEIDEARAYYHAMQKPDLAELAEERLGEEAPAVAAATAQKSYQGIIGRVPYQTPEVIEVPPEPQSAVTSNIFVDGKPMEEDFDYEAEIANRSEDAPYIISREEFMQEEKNYIQQTLTFYEGDDTLTDSNDKDIPDSDEVVGDANLHKFGHGSGDNNVVYVRNDRMSVDFEIVRSTQSFAKDVLGLRHADTRRSRKQPRAQWGDDE